MCEEDAVCACHVIYDQRDGAFATRAQENAARSPAGINHTSTNTPFTFTAGRFTHTANAMCDAIAGGCGNNRCGMRNRAHKSSKSISVFILPDTPPRIELNGNRVFFLNVVVILSSSGI